MKCDQDSESKHCGVRDDAETKKGPSVAESKFDDESTLPSRIRNIES